MINLVIRLSYVTIMGRKNNACIFVFKQIKRNTITHKILFGSKTNEKLQAELYYV